MYYIVRSDIVYRLSFIVIEFPVYVSKISGQQDKDGRSDIICIISFIVIALLVYVSIISGHDIRIYS